MRITDSNSARRAAAAAPITLDQIEGASESPSLPGAGLPQAISVDALEAHIPAEGQHPFLDFALDQAAVLAAMEHAMR